MRKRKLTPPRTTGPDSQAATIIASPTWVDFHEAKRASGLGRSTLADLVRDEKIRSSKIGKRRLIHLGSLLQYIDSCALGPPVPTKGGAERATQ